MITVKYVIFFFLLALLISSFVMSIVSLLKNDKIKEVPYASTNPYTYNTENIYDDIVVKVHNVANVILQGSYGMTIISKYIQKENGEYVLVQSDHKNNTLSITQEKLDTNMFTIKHKYPNSDDDEEYKCDVYPGSLVRHTPTLILARADNFELHDLKFSELDKQQETVINFRGFLQTKEVFYRFFAYRVKNSV